MDVSYLQTREEATKSRRANVLPLHAQVRGELRAFRPADATATGAVLPDVPVMRIVRLNLAHAGIEYGNR